MDSSGDRPANQPISPKHETQLDVSYVAQDHTVPYHGYASGGGGAWNGYSQYVNADGLHVMSPVVYNDNPSLLFHSGYGYNADIGYGQYSPVGSPLPPFMVDGQLYSAQQLPYSPTYYPQQPVAPTDLMPPESPSIDNMFFGPTSSYLVNLGNVSGNVNSNQLSAPPIYPQPMGILGSYDSNFGQVPQHQRSSHGFGMVSGSQYPLAGGSYQTSSYGGASYPYSVSNDLNQFSLDKGRRRDKDQDSISLSNDSRDIFNDRNRGPRASKIKGKSATEQGGSLPGGSKKSLSASGIILDSFNRQDFTTEYEDAKFFIIKSFSEDNVHKSIKYGVWASTPHGNKKLDASYQVATETKPSCPIFLFFSVNASGQFCGVAEMIGAVNFEKDAEYWQQDRWTGQFPVKWHMVKDVPNIRFRHILLDNNDNKPVTHSRDSQEVGLKQGVEMLKIFKEHEARTSILDDFYFYDDREKALRDRKTRQQACSTTDSADTKEIDNKTDLGATSSKKDALVSLDVNALNQLSTNLSQSLVIGGESGKKIESSEKESVEDPKTSATLGGS